jgi:proteasome accessory factor A
MARRGSLFRRLLGLETEYAIRFAPDGEHPGNDVAFQAVKRALSHLVATRPGHSAPGRDQLFTQNGGAFYYEYLPHCLWGGLVEGATPECRGPGQLLVYQRAQEELLLAALPLAEDELRSQGFPGRLGLLKNSRDAEGHVYGSQENYEVPIARGLGLALYRLGVAALLPLLLVQTLATYLLVLLILIGVILGTVVMLFVPRWRRRLEQLSEDQRELEITLGRFQLWFTLIVTWPITTLFALLLRLVAFRRERRRALAFLVTRTVIVGAGSVDGDRRFRLAEKAQSIRKLMRSTILPEDRPIFDTGNLIKMLAAPFNLQLDPVVRLFRQRQRLQLNLADSNRAQVAEYLKVGTAALVLDMIGDDRLAGAPRLRDPVAALRALADDPTLRTPLELAGGATANALEIQRWYQEQARDFLRESTATSMEARQVVRLWGEVLDAYEEGDPGRLVGRVDWVTKRYLLERCGAEDDAATLKTLDLRYHELGEGYFDQLARAGETAVLADPAAVERATREPPEDSPAFVRGGLIRSEAGSGARLIVSWDSAYVGQRLRGKVIPFRPRRRRGP